MKELVFFFVSMAAGAFFGLVAFVGVCALTERDRWAGRLEIFASVAFAFAIFYFLIDSVPWNLPMAISSLFSLGWLYARR